MGRSWPTRCAGLQRNAHRAQQHQNGIWAHDDARKSARIAGANVLDDLKLSVPAADTRFAGVHPTADEEIAITLPEILTTLAAAVPSQVGSPQPM